MCWPSTKNGESTTKVITRATNQVNLEASANTPKSRTRFELEMQKEVL